MSVRLTCPGFCLFGALLALASATKAGPRSPTAETQRQETLVVEAENAELQRFNPPWHTGPMVPLPHNTQSLEVRQHDTPVWTEPKGKRRGSLLRGARLPIFGSRGSSGECTGRWFLVGVEAWLCGDAVALSRERPGQTSSAEQDSDLPYDYYFVGVDGALGYANRTLVGEGIPDSQLEPGFVVALQQVIEENGNTIGYSSNGLWLSLDDLVPVRGSAFAGVKANEGENLDVVWVLHANRSAFDKPGGKALRRLPTRSALRVLERLRHRGTEWSRVGANEWIRDNDVRRSTPLDAPLNVQPSERWIDVDLKTQVLQAYVGPRVVFSTLVSTGLGVGQQETATPIGEHRVWVKLLTSDMTNVEDDAASRYYAIEAVPWVMFFKAGYALHAAFWHDNFGARRSHGCINLSPKDAKFLFQWTTPVMPIGWYAVHPTAGDMGTRIRVR